MDSWGALHSPPRLAAGIGLGSRANDKQALIDKLRSRSDPGECPAPLRRPFGSPSRMTVYQMRTRSAGLRHMASPGRVPKALWKASRFISGA